MAVSHDTADAEEARQGEGAGAGRGSEEAVEKTSGKEAPGRWHELSRLLRDNGFSGLSVAGEGGLPRMEDVGVVLER